MLLLHRRDARRRGDEADELDRLGAELLEAADRGAGRMAGRQHRIDDDDDARGNVVRHLQVVLDGGERFGVTVDADMPDARRGDEVEHAVDEAEPGAQDRHEAQFLAGEDRRHHPRQRRLDLARRQRQIARRLVEDQRRDLAQERTELAGRDVPAANQAQLVLDQRVVDDDDVTVHLSP